MIRAGTAHHEAGHAVVAEALGFPPTGATVIAEGDTLGSVWVALGEATVEDRLVIAYAGQEAQRRGVGPSQLMFHGSAADDARAREFALEGKDATGVNPSHLLAGAKQRAAELVGRLWPVIDHVAGELERRGVLERPALWHEIEYGRKQLMNPSWWIGEGWFDTSPAGRDKRLAALGARPKAKRSPRRRHTARREHPGHVATSTVSVLCGNALVELTAGQSIVSDGHELVRRYPQYFEEIA